mmetsp:Transcript_13468/g.31499  ORF Transcript_13468/g.31499 Transcript_13468/m.31499 type:complete len:109 (+) Transcript_13468:66-392(+)
MTSHHITPHYIPPTNPVQSTPLQSTPLHSTPLQINHACMKLLFNHPQYSPPKGKARHARRKVCLTRLNKARRNRTTRTTPSDSIPTCTVPYLLRTLCCISNKTKHHNP